MSTTNNGHLINDKSCTVAEALAGLADDITVTPIAMAAAIDAKIADIPGAVAATDAEAIAQSSDAVALVPSNLPALLGWKECYVAALTQEGGSAPVATELLNTLSGGSVLWEYSGSGTYTGSLLNAFPVGRTLVFGDKMVLGVSAIEIAHTDVGTLTVLAYDISDITSPSLADDLVTDHLIMLYIMPE